MIVRLCVWHVGQVPRLDIVLLRVINCRTADQLYDGLETALRVVHFRPNCDRCELLSDRELPRMGQDHERPD